jgi:hypothetical protein
LCLLDRQDARLAGQPCAAPHVLHLKDSMRSWLTRRRLLKQRYRRSAEQGVHTITLRHRAVCVALSIVIELLRCGMRSGARRRCRRRGRPGVACRHQRTGEVVFRRVRDRVYLWQGPNVRHEGRVEADLQAGEPCGHVIHRWCRRSYRRRRLL